MWNITGNRSSIDYTRVNHLPTIYGSSVSEVAHLYWMQMIMCFFVHEPQARFNYDLMLYTLFGILLL